jgi:hypothetical protein
MSHNTKIPQNTFSVAWATLALPRPYRQKFRGFSGKAVLTPVRPSWSSTLPAYLREKPHFTAYFLGEPIMSDVPAPVVILLVVVSFLIGFLLRGFLND